jgi:hypothetical protein
MDVACFFLQKGTRVSIKISAKQADYLPNSIEMIGAKGFAFCH